jgi:hypothetical protein
MFRIGLKGFTRLQKGIALAKPCGLGSRCAPLRYMCTKDNSGESAEERETIEYDVVIVGGGPAGLATAIKLKQLQEKHGVPLDVCIIEKGSEIGSHILSGNCFEPEYFEELFPNWAKMENPPPLNQKVNFFFLKKNPGNIRRLQDFEWSISIFQGPKFISTEIFRQSRQLHCQLR